MADTPRIYVACLAAYNGGRLHGAWIDADQRADEIHDAINVEWTNREADVSFEIGESTSIENVAAIAELLREHESAGAIAYNHFSDLDEARKALTDQYYGEWSSLADWAEDYLKDTGGLENVPEALRNYIDFARWANDLEMSGDIFSEEVDGKVHIFSNH